MCEPGQADERMTVLAPAVNGAGIQVIDGKVKRCPVDFDEDDCLAPHEPTAWSSPIFLNYPKPTNPAN